MIRDGIIRVAAVITVVCISTSAGGARSGNRGQNAFVRFLATSTLLRATRGPNEDTYLAELSLSPGGESALVRLVDDYPSEFPPLSREVLVSRSGTLLRVKREVGCDLPYAQLVLRSAPGDPIAMLPGKLDYKPHLGQTPGPKAILPCFRTIR